MQMTRVIICLLFVYSTAANSENITLLSVDGAHSPYTVKANEEIVFHINYYNDFNDNFDLIANTFKVYTSDGIKLDGIDGEWNPDINWSAYFESDMYVSHSGFGLNNINLGAQFGIPGLPVGFNDYVFSITAPALGEEYIGQQVCLDSVTHPADFFYWVWSIDNGRTIPTWGGPYCFTVVGCTDTIGVDSDNDYIGNPCDNCPFDSNLDQSDIDEDGVGDVCDNCPDISNPNQSDLDNDGIGNACDDVCMTASDFTGNGTVDISDLTGIVDYMFRQGLPPACPPDKSLIRSPRLATDISLDYVDGEFVSGMILTNHEISFYFRITNQTGYSVSGLQNSFRIYSPEGATWGGTSADWNPAINWNNYFDGIHDANLFSPDGVNEDSVGFSGLSIFRRLPNNFDEVSFILKLTSIPDEYTGKQLCIDSTWVPPSGGWIWATQYDYIIPTWDGPHCFRIVSCDDQGEFDRDSDGIGDVCDNCPDDSNPDQLDNDLDGIGNACDNCINMPNPNQSDSDSDGFGNACDNVCMTSSDYNGDGVVDISDLTGLVDYMFREGPPPVCPVDK